MITHPSIFSEIHHHRLVGLLKIARRNRLEDPVRLDALAGKLKAATVLYSDQIPADVVTLYARLKLEFPDVQSTRLCRIVLPAELGVSTDRVSVLSPLGTALIGQRAGDDLEYMVRGRPQSVRIAEILSQSEAAVSRETGRAMHPVMN